jgi:hypothetical protein
MKDPIIFWRWADRLTHSLPSTVDAQLGCLRPAHDYQASDELVADEARRHTRRLPP